MAEKQATTPPEPAPVVNLGIHDVTRIPVYPDTPPKESPLPEARAEIGQTAFERNQPRNHKPAPPKRRFLVELNGKAAEFVAFDANEAWAMFCDANKEWPSRRQVRPTIVDKGVAA